jgi:glycosyltransferase involved in cell wall biosynthesis
MSDMPNSVRTAISSENQPAPAAAATRKYKVLLLTTHVIQYASPVYRLFSRDPRIDLLVAYCSLQGAEAGLDPEFGVEVQWDVPLLDGYRWVHVPNKALRPGLGRFFGLWNPGLWKLLRAGHFDAVVIYTGYMNASFWLTVLAAKSKGVPVLISSDTTTLQPRDGKRWKAWIKPFLLPRVFGVADMVLVYAQAAKELTVRMGVPEECIALIRSAGDKESWLARTRKFDRAAVRAVWGVPDDAPVVFYCAKLQEWKRPLDLLRAFARAAVAGAYLVYAGEGPQRGELEAEARTLGISDRVRFLGFVNLSQLPGSYVASDLFALPSVYDPCPLVVLEAMLTGLPVILSDAVLGRLEMIDPGKSGYIYPSGDVDALAEILRNTLGNRTLLEELKAGVRQQMKSWTPEEYLDDWVGAIETANHLKQRKREHSR